MKSSIRLSLAALAAPALAIALAAGAAAQSASPPPPPMHAGPWANEREALLDAKLGGLKAGLKLNPEQEKLWEPFEASVRNAAELRMHHMMEMMHAPGGAGMMESGEHAEGGHGGFSIDHLEAMADHMSEGAAALKQIVAAARPLYASLDENQKRDFDFLSRAMIMLGHGHGHPGMEWGHHDGGWDHPRPGPHPGDWGSDEDD